MPAAFKPCVIIPVFNHEKPLAAIVEQVIACGLPCFLIDDGSHEVCAAVVAGLAQRFESVRALRLPVNLGKGGAVKAGLNLAYAEGYSHALQVDADGQHDLRDLGKFLEQAQLTPQAVITGQPVFDVSIPKLRFYARYLTHIWVWMNTLSLAIPDAMCGFRVYPLAACAQLMQTRTLENRMAFDVEILVRLYWQGLEVVNIPTKVAYPKDGLSHFRGLEDNWRISLTHARLFAGMLIRFPALLARHWR